MLLLPAQLKVNAAGGGVAAVVVDVAVVVVAAGGSDSRFVVAEPLLPFEVQTERDLAAISEQSWQRKRKRERDRNRERQER